ncbi:MAG: S-adenosylmethionine decarboxylase proenzyme [Myxococcales bacterium]|nr:S-adenosylmethionine decarboxylase proenzyme [Myxococcales bacterium]
MGSYMSTLTFFEGPEKKLELVVTPDSASLRSLGDDTWRDVVCAAGADVISVIRNDHCNAYLLSESSLFVFDDYCVMITCGLTTLVDSVARLLQTISADSIAFLVYERKNEHFPERQPATFLEDARRLRTMVPGRALRFGDEHGHYVQMFHTTRAFVPETNDPTIEVLMHGIDERVAAQFTTAEVSEDRSLAVALGVDSVLPGFDTSEHVFDPAGYSLNALRGEEYYTLHVTPEAMGSYVSFETNHDFGSDLTGLVGAIVELFQPRAFDVVTFLPEGEPKLKLAGYQLGDHVVRSLGGYQVTYRQYYIPPSGPRGPYELPL